MISKENFYVITGGPGSGKTTLIEQLKKTGYNCVPETGRKIIKDQLASGGTALPWLNTGKYANLMLQHSIHDYISLSAEADTIFLIEE